MAGYSQTHPFIKERKKLGETIATWRKKKDLTQEDLADIADINVSYLAKIENGYVNTTIRYLIKISQAMGLKVKDLIDF